MAEITLPDELLEQVERALPESVSADEYVADAVREKLAWQDRKAEFFRLSDGTYRLMEEKGLSETEMLADFETFRETVTRE
jgi:metal-responsive CopG/Arc/MetJ family transcriptional regulator